MLLLLLLRRGGGRGVGGFGRGGVAEARGDFVGGGEKLVEGDGGSED